MQLQLQTIQIHFSTLSLNFALLHADAGEHEEFESSNAGSIPVTVDIDQHGTKTVQAIPQAMHCYYRGAELSHRHSLNMLR